MIPSRIASLALGILLLGASTALAYWEGGNSLSKPAAELRAAGNAKYLKWNGDIDFSVTIRFLHWIDVNFDWVAVNPPNGDEGEAAGKCDSIVSVTPQPGKCYRSTLEVDAYQKPLWGPEEKIDTQGFGSGEHCEPEVSIPCTTSMSNEGDVAPASSCEQPPPPETCHCCSCTGPEPLVLDLNGDGIHTTSESDPVAFDLDADGHRELLTWTHPETSEGLLWVDLNKNNLVDDGGELFGIGTTLPSGAKAVDGFEALTVYDQPEHGGNGDGWIDREDKIWAHLRVWVDRNHDGVSDALETGPIHRFGVRELSLEHTVSEEPDQNGNVHLLRGHYRAFVHGEREHREERDLHGLVFRKVPGSFSLKTRSQEASFD